MTIFDFHEKALGRYKNFVRSYVKIADREIEEFVMGQVLGEEGEIWPEPLIQLSPSYAASSTVDELAAKGLIHPETARIFRRKDGAPFRLYRHQVEALKRATQNQSYVLTSGTGSGKSFAYFLPIIDRIVRNPDLNGPVALIVYPMNALVNSQLNALENLKRQYKKATGKPFPVRFARYTGQTSEDERRAIRENPPHIILTNYVMGEFLLVRPEDRSVIQPPASETPFFLVFDELHTHRGRQGSDVAMLVRRMRSRVKDRPVVHIGTSATLVTDRKATPKQRRRVVADFASKFFGTNIDPDNVIEETLEPVTVGGPPDEAELKRGFAEPLPEDAEPFVRHPLVRFVEYAMGIEEEAPGYYRRRSPRRVHEVARELANIAGVPLPEAEKKLREVLSQAIHVKRDGRPLFAFKLHQFISQTPPLYATLGHTGEREIATEFQHSPERPLYPLYFCRSCGQEYYRVRKDQNGKQFLPAPDFSVIEEEETQVGYLTYVEDFDPERDLPDAWLDEQGRVASNRRDRVPELYYVSPSGKYIPAKDRVEGREAPNGARPFYFQKAPFSLCLNCGADWVTLHYRASEFRKLTYLGSEGRTSSTSILGSELLDAARASEGQVREKLLTFTDNRQDASLQAGHFNDFVRSVLLRASLYRALGEHKVLRISDLGEEVLKHSGLELRDYAINPQLKAGPAAERVKGLFADLIRYRLLTDLQRDWRFVHPSLEEVGLLDVGYAGAEDPEFLNALVNVLKEGGADADSTFAKKAAFAILDYLRKNLVIQNKLLAREHWRKFAQETTRDLQGFWQIDPDAEGFPRVGVLSLGGKPRKGKVIRLTANSRLGRYLRSLGVRKEDFPEFAEALVRVFVAYDLLRELEGSKGLYQIPDSALLWRRGTGQPRIDPLQHKGRNAPKVNSYFKALYQKNPRDLVRLEAREHTAQVPPPLREERESRFRGEDGPSLPYLVASPTLELGVDIADLDMVHLRNIPPTPANYAQRVGRAGRQGQPGLIVAFAGAFNHHDRYFFRRPQEMVAGAVRAPILDLANESLLRSHIFAEWLANVGLPLHNSVADVLDVHDPQLSFHEEVREQIERWNNEAKFEDNLVKHIERILANDLEELAKEPWFSSTWVEDVIRSAPKAFDRAFDEWRLLYKGAREQASRGSKLRLDGRSKEERMLGETLYNEAMRQIDLLLQRDVTREEGDFYPYRYLASQEFLPGYNLMALPVRAWVPRGEGEYISRPRVLAVHELAPTSTIYHEGQKWTPKRLLLPPGGAEKRTVKKAYCRSCGAVNEADASKCRVCGTTLSGINLSMWRGIEFVGVSLRRQARITSNEEERSRRRFNIEIGFEPAPRSTLTAKAKKISDLVLEYMPAARIHYFNHGRKSKGGEGTKGFYLDVDAGELLSDSEVETAKARGRNVDRFGMHVAVTQNALRFSVGRALPEIFKSYDPVSVLFSLAHALKRGMERFFQVEEGELGLEIIGEREELSYLFIEQAEGGLGVLRRLVEDPNALAEVARAALEVLHFNPETGEDLQPERCKGACYECLLSYSNQSLFERLNRYLARPYLLELAKETVVLEEEPQALSTERLEQLEEACESSLEKRFLRVLFARGIALPDEAQYRIGQAHTIADFLYRPNIAVYVDGPHHQSKHRKNIDAQQRSTLLELGFIPVAFTTEDIEAIERGEDPPPLKELLDALANS